MSVIKYIYFLILVFFFSSCLTNRSVFQDIPLNEKELNLLCIFAYFENQSEACVNNCHYKVSRELEYFDDCVVSKYSERFENVGSVIDSSKQIIIKPTSFSIPEVGEVSFRRDSPDLWDYKFSPILFNQEENNIFGQVVNSKGEKSWIMFNLVGDKVFFAGSLRYNYHCEML